MLAKYAVAALKFVVHIHWIGLVNWIDLILQFLQMNPNFFLSKATNRNH